MIGSQIIGSIINNYILHIQINTINLPYRHLPRPYRSNQVSRWLRRVFERKSIRRWFGIQILTAMIAVPLTGDILAQVGPSHGGVEVDYSLTQEVVSPQGPLTTETRQFILPVERAKAITQRFQAGHPGYDISSYIGDDVYAFTSGRVIQIESGQFGWGKYVVIDHGHNLVSVYAHLQSFSVKIGQFVDTGEKIGEIGMTGYTTGPHLHFEVHDNGVPVSPYVYLGK